MKKSKLSVSVVLTTMLVLISPAFQPVRAQSVAALDTTFGTNGSARFFISGGDSTQDFGTSAVIEPDGKIIVAGYSLDNSIYTAFGIARLDSTGKIDNSFGTGGTSRTHIAGGASVKDWGNSVILQPDGKIVVAGLSMDGSDNAGFAVARFNFNGALDNTFGENGTVRTYITGGDSTDDEGYSAALQADGKIVVAGFSHDDVYTSSFALARFNSDGTLDGSFGTNGTARTHISGGDPSGEDEGYSVAIQADGKIVVAGSSPDISGNRAFAVACFNSNGTLDSAFGSNGSTRTFISSGGSYHDGGYSVVVQPDGKIIVAGYSFYNRTVAFAIARFNSDGTNDNSFGINGSARSYISGGSGDYDEGRSVAIQSDGKIVIGGSSYDASGPGTYAFAVERFDPNGIIDSSFATNGSARAFIAGGTNADDRAYGIAIQPNGKIILAGYSWDGTSENNAFAAARFLPDSAKRPLSVRNRGAIDPETCELFQNYPNPFNPTTTINYQIPMTSHVTLKVYDVLGREVRTLVNEREKIGRYEVRFDASNLPSGVYFYRISAAGDGGKAFTSVKKLMLVK